MEYTVRPQLSDKAGSFAGRWGNKIAGIYFSYQTTGGYRQ